MLILLYKETVGSYEAALPYIEKGEKVVEIMYDDSWFPSAREITAENYDAIVAEAYETRSFPRLYCAVLMFQNDSIVSVPKGTYEIAIVKGMYDED